MGVSPDAGNLFRSAAVFSGYPKYWYHTWGIACNDPLDTGNIYGRHVPMVRPTTIDQFLSSFQFGPCNDGRPVLVLNEPEIRGQDDLTPQRALDIITSVANSSWRGQVYVGGVVLQNYSYIDDMLNLWAQQHGGSRLIPGVDGFHVHPYVVAVPGVTPNVRGEALLQFVDLDVQTLRGFIAARKAEGYSGGVVVSEFGYLGNTSLLGRRDTDMAAVMERYVSEFDSIPELRGWAWFTDYIPTTPNTNSDIGNLVFENGTLTLAGERYRTLLQQRQ